MRNILETDKCLIHYDESLKKYRIILFENKHFICEYWVSENTVETQYNNKLMKEKLIQYLEGHKEKLYNIFYKNPHESRYMSYECLEHYINKLIQWIQDDEFMKGKGD